MLCEMVRHEKWNVRILERGKSWTLKKHSMKKFNMKKKEHVKIQHDKKYYYKYHH